MSFGAILHPELKTSSPKPKWTFAAVEVKPRCIIWSMEKGMAGMCLQSEPTTTRADPSVCKCQLHVNQKWFKVSACIKLDLSLHPQAIIPLPAGSGTRLCWEAFPVSEHTSGPTGSKNPLGAVAVQGLNNLHSVSCSVEKKKKKQIFKSVFCFHCLYRATKSLKNEMKTHNTVIYKCVVSSEVHFSMWITVEETRNNKNIYSNCVTEIRNSICIYQLWENNQSNF